LGGSKIKVPFKQFSGESCRNKRVLVGLKNYLTYSRNYWLAPRQSADGPRYFRRLMS
jgi:hypothetical protein